jgi:hypothetical protein
MSSWYSASAGDSASIPRIMSRVFAVCSRLTAAIWMSGSLTGTAIGKPFSSQPPHLQGPMNSMIASAAKRGVLPQPFERRRETFW